MIDHSSHHFYLSHTNPIPLSSARCFHGKRLPSTRPALCCIYIIIILQQAIIVKLTLASTIYNVLKLMGVQVFLDQEELEVGDFFPQAIEEAMRSASVHIAIISPNYVESAWCLEELSFMFQITDTIIPVFYHVNPSDFHYVTKGVYANKFHQHHKKHKCNSEKPRYKPEKIEEWEKALRSISYLNGCIVAADNCDEGKLLGKIVDTVLNKIEKVPLEVATFPIGLEEAVQDFESQVGCSTGSQKLHIVGIVGMGGSGKTTLAKELYNRKCSSMTRSSFLCNVRDAASTNTLCNLQNILLDELHIQHKAVHNIHQGKKMLVEHLKSLSVLIVLDDVDDVDQIEALLPCDLGRDGFIIITTREKEVLFSCGISSIYHMKLLDPFNAKELFSKHAFQQPYSQLGFENILNNHPNFEDLIEKFVKACNGLPLSLKVFGAMVNNQSRVYWESQLDKIFRILPHKIFECLQVSYEALDEEVQQMFLDVACFFIGAKKSRVVSIWDGSGWSGEVGWETLVNKCLVGLDTNGNIEMHDHLRDLGRQIAACVSPSRIWNEEQINIQNGRSPIRGIVVVTPQPLFPESSDSVLDTYYHLRPPLRALQLLAVKRNDFREEFAASSRELVWLFWWEFDGVNLPPWLSLANLRVLELYDPINLEEVWQDNVHVQPPLQLRELVIRIGWNRASFRGLPRSIGLLKHLKKIDIDGNNGCTMRSLPEGFCHLKSLEFLRLSNFPLLSSLPDDVLKFMIELQVIDLSYCRELKELPHLSTQVLRELNLTETQVRELPNNISQLTKLKTLKIGSNYLISLPESLGALSCLTSLTIDGCKMRTTLPEALGQLSNLQFLSIWKTPVVEIGMGIGSLLGCNLNSLKSLKLSCTRVWRISIPDDCCPTLESLQLVYNENLTEIETLPRNVREITVVECNKLKSMRSIVGLQNLQRLWVEDCLELEVVLFPPYMYSERHIIVIKNCPKVRIIDDEEEECG